MAVKPRIVVVGAGSIGRRHARLLAERSDLRVELCEPDVAALEQAQREVGPLSSYATYDQAIDSAPDMLLIATPPELHRRQTVCALERGIHVLCEKPVSGRLADARLMQVAERQSSALLSIGFNLHFHPAIRRLKQLVDAGVLGTPLQITYKIGSYVTLANSRSRYQADLPGALLLDYAHQPDIIYWLLGVKPERVYMAGIKGGALPLTSDPNVITLICEYSQPLLATIQLNYVQSPERSDCEIIGDQGWAFFDAQQTALRIGSFAQAAETIETIRYDRDEMYRAEHQCFLEAVAGRGRPSSPIDEAIVSMEVIEAAMQSWRSGQSVALSTI